MDILDYEYELLCGSLILNTILLLCILQPNIVKFIHKEHLDWKYKNKRHGNK